MKMQFDPNSKGDHRGIMHGSQHIGAAVRFATGQWGAAGMDGKPRTRELFDTPEAVRFWFECGQ